MNETIKMFLENWEMAALNFYEDARKDYLNKKQDLRYMDLQNYMINHYGKGNYNIIKDNYKDIENIVKKESEKKYNKLIASIEKKAGKIINVINLEIDHKSGNLNGIIKGEKKTVTISTIFAGGHTIQCLHFRTLVK